MFPLQMLFVALRGFLDREQRDAIAFLREENRTLKAQGRDPREPRVKRVSASTT